MYLFLLYSTRDYSIRFHNRQANGDGATTPLLSFHHPSTRRSSSTASTTSRQPQCSLIHPSRSPEKVHMTSYARPHVSTSPVIPTSLTNSLAAASPVSVASSSHSHFSGLGGHLRSHRQKFVADLSQCLLDFVVQLLPTPEELAVKEDVRKLLERLIRSIEPESRLLSFGSTANGFSLRNSGECARCCGKGMRLMGRGLTRYSKTWTCAASSTPSAVFPQAIWSPWSATSSSEVRFSVSPFSSLALMLIVSWRI